MTYLRSERGDKLRHGLELDIHGILSTSLSVEEELRGTASTDIKTRVPQQISFEDVSQVELV